MISKVCPVFIAVVIVLLFPSTVSAFEIPEIIRVGLENRYANVETINISNKELSYGFSTEVGRGQYSLLTASSAFSVRAANGRAVLYDGSAAIVTLESGDNLAGVGEPINLGDRRYRGAIEFNVSGSRISAVNCLTIEEYLYSVVPSEMPPTWHPEALKAQAVAARSYSMTRLSAHRASGYHYCDRTHCQNYVGAGNETQSVIDAVNATIGVLAYYDGTPINAVYSSSNGGYSSASEDVWNEAVPYLRAVEDIYEASGRRWERSFTLSQIQSLLDVNIGTVTRVYISKTAQSGRVIELTIQGTNGSRTLTKDGIRTFFSRADGGSLDSTNFVMQDGSSSQTAAAQVYVVGSGGAAQISVADVYALSAGGELLTVSEVAAISKDSSAIYQASSGVASRGSSQGNTAVFSGRGWGHGVGMSQYGAKDMAEAGYNYAQILKFYYTGVEVG